MAAAGEVLGAFLRLGCASFGGPVAHLGYFHREFVARRGWLTERDWASTVAMCQLLPGPTSTQVAFALGLRRAGISGAVAAWAGFSFPSAAVLAAAGAGLVGAGMDAHGGGWMAGLRALAVAAVARAAWTMARSLGGPARIAAAAACMVAVLALARALGSAWAGFAQVGIIVGAAGAGIALGRRSAEPEGDGPAPAAGAAAPKERARGTVAGLALASILALSFAVGDAAPVAQAAATCVKAGSLVVGGGHVVLPLVERPFIEHGWLDQDTVIAGYALAQAVPGPLFTMVSFLGAAMAHPAGPWHSAGAAAALTACVFAPGLLMVLAAAPAWSALSRTGWAGGAMRGASVAVTGVLAAALVDSVAPAGVTSAATACIAAGSLALLAIPRVPVVAAVALAAAAGALVA